MSRRELPVSDRAAESAGPADHGVGRIETTHGALTPELAGMLGCALGHDAAPMPPTHTGAPLPPLWHWAAFPAFVPLSGLGRDGHPKRGGFLPALDFERRMWAGGRLWFKGALSVGERLHRRSEILSVDFKTGASGDMAFVKVLHDLRGEGGGAIREEQDIVYMPIPASFRAPKPIPAPAAALFDEVLEASPVRLFRYSAATWNGHRIHYDRAYASEVEKYPGLVVHGPMQATLLMEAAMRHSGRAPSHFSYRGVHPLFDGPLRLQATTVEGAPRALALCTVAGGAVAGGTDQDHQGMQARFEWED